jgi:hypothetical protein
MQPARANRNVPGTTPNLEAKSSKAMNGTFAPEALSKWTWGNFKFFLIFIYQLSRHGWLRAVTSLLVSGYPAGHPSDR